MPTCSVLAMCWTLVRLGVMKAPNELVLWGESLKVCSQAHTFLRNSDIQAEKKVVKLLSAWKPEVFIV